MQLLSIVVHVICGKVTLDFLDHDHSYLGQNEFFHSLFVVRTKSFFVVCLLYDRSYVDATVYMYVFEDVSIMALLLDVNLAGYKILAWKVFLFSILRITLAHIVNYRKLLLASLSILCSNLPFPLAVLQSHCYNEV